MEALKDSFRQQLWARYGQPESVDTAAALRLIGKREEVHPRDAHAFRYQSVEAAEAYASANLEHWGHPTLGAHVGEDGSVVGVLDFRPQLASLDREPTDPSLPDDGK
jgi:hypothetical protein